jgi:hypothetical protein
MNNNLKMERPDGWDKPILTPYLENLWGNTIGTFAQKQESHRLCRIDDLMSEIGEDWKGAKPNSVAIVPLMMFFRCHSAFRAAAALGMGGATTEAMTVLRSALEWSGYSALIARNPKLADIWWGRDDDERTRKKLRREFGNEPVLKAIRSFEVGLASIYGALYERVIQFGAHPNEKAVTANLQMVPGTKELALNQIYLQEDGSQLDHWIRTANQVGICALKVFGYIHKDRYEELKMDGRINALSKRL